MVVSLNFKSNSSVVQNRMSKLALKQVPIAVAKSLTFTAKTLQEQNVRDMPTLFDNPTGWTRNAFRIIPAKKNNPRAFVLRKDRTTKTATNAAPSQQHYLEVQQTGGGRPSKAFERAIQARGIGAQKFRYATPTSRQSIGKFGNVTKGQVTKLIEGVSQRGSKFFIPQSSHPLAIKFGDGIYERMKRNKVKKLMHLHTTTPSYRRQFRFYQRMNRYALKAFPRIFQREFGHALRTARGIL